MCGIAGLLLRDPALESSLGSLLTGMLCQVAERGPDSAGIGIYGDERLTPFGHAAVSVLGAELGADDAVRTLRHAEASLQDVRAVVGGDTAVLSADTDVALLEAAARAAFPDAVIIGRGHELAVLKGVGDPVDLAGAFSLREASGWQGIAHTRMATESAVTSAHSHPFSVADDFCLVHNGSFANHATLRRELQAGGVVFDSDNDSEVGARFVAAQLAAGFDLEKSLHLLCERFDGFYTLLVTTGDSFAVVRDAIACKPAVIAETPEWVAMASEYRALTGLPGIENARVFEPEPEEVYTWTR